MLCLLGRGYGDSAARNWEGRSRNALLHGALAQEQVALADERDEFCTNVVSVAFCLEMRMEVAAMDAGWIVG